MSRVQMKREVGARGAIDEAITVLNVSEARRDRVSIFHLQSIQQVTRRLTRIKRSEPFRIMHGAGRIASPSCGGDTFSQNVAGLGQFRWKLGDQPLRFV